MTSTRRGLVAALALAATIGLAACGSSEPAATSQSSTMSTPTSSAGAATGSAGASTAESSASATAGSGQSGSAPAGPIALPDELKQRGVLNVATFYNYPPYTVVKDGQLTGIEADLVRAIAKELGVEAKFNDLAFEAMIPSVVNGRNDVMIGAVADTDERRQQVSFLDLFNSRMSVLVKAGNPAGIDPANLCGRTFVVATGSTYQMGIVDKVSKQCVADGKPEIKQLQVADPGAVYLALGNSRGEFTVQDPAKAKSIADQDGGKTMQVLDGHLPGDEGSRSGWVFAKGSDPLRAAFVQAIDRLIADGSWQQILDKAGLGSSALMPVEPNPSLAAG